MRPALLAAASLLAGGCASSSLLLLPDEGGGQGEVAVLESGGRPQDTVVAEGNSRTRIGGARPSTRAAGRLSAREQDALTNLPDPPARFTLYFREGGTDLTPDSGPQLQAMLAVVSRRPGAEVQVTGHTDTLGGEDDNDRLSMERATEIRALLIRQGLSADITSAVGRGERELKVQTGDGVRNAENRRVEVIVR